MAIQVVLPHDGQILTTKSTIDEFMSGCNHALAMNMVYLLATGLDDEEQRLRLYYVCARLFYLSRLVYFDGTKIEKLPYAAYEKGLFEPYTENKEEMQWLLEYWNKIHEDRKVQLTEQFIDETWDSFVNLKNLWCRFLACRTEQAYISEFGYALEYVIRHKGHLPMPEYTSECSLFPNNYKDFQYDEGIAEYFEHIMDGLF